MFVIETFEAGCQPRHPPTHRIDTIKRCATTPKDWAPSPTSLYLAYARPKGAAHSRLTSLDVSKQGGEFKTGAVVLGLAGTPREPDMGEEIGDCPCRVSGALSERPPW
jgi:hypothetical protein